MIDKKWSFDSTLFIITYLTVLAQIKQVTAKGWVLQENNSTYEPLDVCMFAVTADFSYYWTCDDQQQLYFSAYFGSTCTDTMIEYQATAYKYDCDEANIFNDYIEYTGWDLNLISETARCDNIINYESPNSFAQVTNKCLYEPRFNVYKMSTCTDTLWTTFRYLDANCQFMVHSSNTIEECKHNETFIEITTCTTKMNSVGDQFGYVQYRKYSNLRPLNQCITPSYTYSYLFTCNDNTPYLHSWSDNSCGPSSIAEIEGVIPFAFSCSSNTFNYGRIDVYENNNNCAGIDTQSNHTSLPYIINQCYNLFDENNTMKSEIIYCNDTALWSIVYNLPDCNGNGDSFVSKYYTETCSNNDQNRYIIDCQINGLSIQTTPEPFISTTVTPITTLQTTSTTFFSVTPAPTSANKRIVYVTSDGEDNIDCFFDGINCGTFRYASNAANYLYRYHDLTEIEIIIQGQNPIAIAEKLQDYIDNGISANPCLPFETNELYTSFDSITYTFDPNYIHSMSDWYNATLCENHDGDLWEDFFGSASSASFTFFTFTVNNLIIDAYTFEGRVNQPFHIAKVDTFICNNCIFKDIVINYAHHDDPNDDRTNQQSTLILAANVKLKNCIIDNITYTPSSATIDKYNYDYSFIIIDNTVTYLPSTHSFSLSITDNTTITNITALSSFVNILMESGTYSFHGLIHNTTFDEIYIMDSIMYADPDALHAISSSFDMVDINFWNINHGSILYSLHGKSQITISNISISTSQTIPQYLQIQSSIGRDNLDYYSLFVFDSVSDIVNINNVNLEYQYGHEILTRCRDAYGGSTFQTIFNWHQIGLLMKVGLDFYHFWYWCDIPMQFIHNAAIMTINQLHASNDITDTIINEFRGFIQDEIDALGVSVDANRDVYIELDYYYSNTDDYGMIYNELELTIKSFYVYGYGVHETIILNVDGEVNIDNMVAIPDTFCVDHAVPCSFDADALQTHYWIRFNGKGSRCDNKQLHVSNSYLYGAKTQTIFGGGGFIYLNNITIQMSTTAIMTDSDVFYLELKSSEMKDIGVYYAGSSRRLTPFSQVWIPFALQPLEVVIEDTIFSYVSPFQFDLFDATNYWETIFLDPFETQTRKITLINNIFEINDINVLSPYPWNQSLHYIYENDDAWKRYLDDNITFDDIDKLIKQYFIYNATFLIPNDADIQMINNKFAINPNNRYVNQAILIKNNIPWVTSYKGDNDTSASSNVCMSGNEFVNFAMWLKNGNVTSCVKSDIIDYMDKNDCHSYGTFGSIYQSALRDNQRKSNIFNILSNEIETIIRAEKGTFIALENNIINIYVNGTDILNMVNGNYLFVNTQIEDKNVSNNTVFDILINGNNCVINCYSRIEEQYISVLHVTCPNYKQNTTFDDSVSIDTIYDPQNYFVLPFYIEVHPLNNGEYVPGQKIPLKYFLYDMFYNEISNTLINHPIVLNYESADTYELLPNFQLIINEYGECSQCIDGITFSSVTLNAVGKNYSFNAVVENNHLFANNALNITVTDCPMGYGLTGAKMICDVCNRGYFNVFSMDNNLCYYCNEHLLDGISCPGSSNIIIDYNYWVSIYQYSDNYQLIFNENTTQFIISYKCPPLYCCQLEDGCNLITDNKSLCAANRDFEAPLCGKCLEGYSELFGTNNCGECDHNYWERLLIPLIYGLLWALFVLTTKSTKNKSSISEAHQNNAMEDKPEKCKAILDKCCVCFNNNNNNNNNNKNDKMTRKEYLDSLEIMVSRNIVYYYQGLSYILTTSGIQLALYGFVELFNMNILTITSSSNVEGYCLFKDMDMIQKITIQLTTTFFIIFFTILPFLLSSICSINICCCFKRKLHFGQSLISVMFICVGQILSVLFKLLACRQIGNISVHYFFGAQECYNLTWLISMVFLILVFVIFFGLFVWIWCKRRGRDDSNINQEDKEKESAYYPIINCYKKRFWYWECILFIRRSILALAFIVFDNNELKVCIGIALLIYSFIHVKFNPFEWKFENKLETYLIVATAICVFIDTTYSSQTNATFSNVVMSILILLPLIWYLFFIFIYCKALCNPSKKDINSGFSQIEMVDEAETDLEDNIFTTNYRNAPIETNHHETVNDTNYLHTTEVEEQDDNSCSIQAQRYKSIPL